jgi:hypothetical protein
MHWHYRGVIRVLTRQNIDPFILLTRGVKTNWRRPKGVNLTSFFLQKNLRRSRASPEADIHLSAVEEHVSVVMVDRPPKANAREDEVAQISGGGVGYAVLGTVC